MSIQLNSHHFPLQPWMMWWGGTCGSAAQKPIMFHWGKAIFQPCRRFWEQQQSYNKILWFLTSKLSENMHFSRLWSDHPQAGSDTQLHVCAAPRLFKWWHSLSPHLSFNWQFPLSEGHSQKFASGPKSTLKIHVSMYQHNFWRLGTDPSQRGLLPYLPHPFGIPKSSKVIYIKIFIYLLFSIFEIQAFPGGIPTSKTLSAILTVTFLDKHNHVILWWQLFPSILSTRKYGNNI